MSASKTNTSPLVDQAARDSIKNHLTTNMLVEAAAGTGKTTSMVGRMVELIRNDICKISTIVAVTFTRKSASELRSRFQEVLEKEAGEASGKEADRLKAALTRIDQCFIGTIHSFCARLLRERPVEAGIDPGFGEVDDAEDEELKKIAWAEQCARMYDNSDPFIAEALSNDLELAQLQDSFNQFADHLDVTDWQDKGAEITDSDFDKYRKQLLDYIDRIGKEITLPPSEDYGTCELLPKYELMLKAEKRYDFNNLHEALIFMNKINGKTKVTQKFWESKEIAKREIDEWEAFKKQTLEPACSLARQRLYPGMIKAFTEAAKIYNNLRTERGLLNFQDLLLTSARLLRDSVAARRYFQKRFTHLLIDEFQDTDPIQAEVMLLLTATDVTETDWRKCQPKPGSLFVVGDPKQSIYRFRRADIKTYGEVKKIITDNGGEVIQLSSNFRTSPDIISWVNGVFSSERCFPAEACEQSPAYVPLDNGRIDGTRGDFHGVNILDIPADQNNNDLVIPFEANLIADTIKEAVDSGKTVTIASKDPSASPQPRPVRYSDFLIIHYFTKQMTDHAKALQERGIPCQVTGGATLNEVNELKLLHLFLKAAVELNNSVALLTVMRGEIFGISDRVLYAFKKAGGRFNYNYPLPESMLDEEKAMIAACFDLLKAAMTDLRSLPTIAAIERITARLGLFVLAATHDGGDIEAGSLGKAFEILREQDANLWSITQVIEFLGEMVTKVINYDGISACSKVRDQVRLMNLHKVKGLEAPIVFLANATGKYIHGIELHVNRSQTSIDGFLPAYVKNGYQNKLSIEPPDWRLAREVEEKFSEAERIRLQYVAATRAGSCLFVSQRESGERFNWWTFYENNLKNISGKGKDKSFSLKPGVGNLVEMFPPQSSSALPAEAPTAPVLETIKLEDVSKAEEGIADALISAQAPGYAVVSAKAFSLSKEGAAAIGTGQINFTETSCPTSELDPDESGADWGNVIHSLLELKMKDTPSREAMLIYAESALQEFALSIDMAEDAVSVVEDVTRSRIWQDACKSDNVLTEVPFQFMVGELGIAANPGESSLPTLLRGVIDLVFHNSNGGWTVVDYKTDHVSGDKLGKALQTYAPQLRLYSKAWEACSGEKADEAGILFIRNGEFHQIDLDV